MASLAEPPFSFASALMSSLTWTVISEIPSLSTLYFCPKALEILLALFKTFFSASCVAYTSLSAWSAPDTDKVMSTFLSLRLLRSILDNLVNPLIALLKFTPAILLSPLASALRLFAEFTKLLALADALSKFLAKFSRLAIAELASDEICSCNSSTFCAIAFIPQ